MRSLLFCMISLCAAASCYGGDAYLEQIFANQTTSRTSATMSLGKYRKMTAIFNGASSSSNTASTLYGTVTMQCAPTATGPYTTMKDVGNNAVTTTSNAHFNIETLCGYFRMVWTRTKQKVNAWIRLAE